MTEAVEQQPAVVPATESSESFVAVLDNEVDLTVQNRTKNKSKQYFIYVKPDETVGHYSDWLGLASTASIRRLNGLQYSAVLHMGQILKLPISKPSVVDKFEQLRQEFHRVLVEQFKEHYEIVGVKPYRVRPGDSVWKVAIKQQLPIWVVTSFNPELRKAAPKVGVTLSLPVLKSRKS